MEDQADRKNLEGFVRITPQSLSQFREKTGPEIRRVFKKNKLICAGWI
jgi:hypothetical protein